jgi:hypothetical protein
MNHKVTVPKKKGNLTQMTDELSDHGLKLGNAKQGSLQAALISEKMSRKAYSYIDKALGIRKSRWVVNFNNDPLLKKWFGKVDKKAQAQDVLRRMDSAKKRIRRGLKIRLRPQKKQSNARNTMGFMGPKDFQVFPKMFTHRTSGGQIDTDTIAAIYIHELLHLWFKDQKLDGKTVYGSDLAKELAKREPEKARKSAENYEHFSLAVWNKS